MNRDAEMLAPSKINGASTRIPNSESEASSYLGKSDSLHYSGIAIFQSTRESIGIRLDTFFTDCDTPRRMLRQHLTHRGEYSQSRIQHPATFTLGNASSIVTWGSLRTIV